MRVLKGKAFPCVRASVSSDPFCGEIPATPPESESAHQVSVTG